MAQVVKNADNTLTVSMQITIKTAHGYLSFQPDGRLEYRDKVGPWETFDVDGLVLALPPSLFGGGQAPVPGGGGGGGGAATVNAKHVGPGPNTADRAFQVIRATAEEFPHLLATFNSEDEAVRAAAELLLRTIWHLQLAGFQASRQKNPSGAISNDKLTIFIDGAWKVYDIYSLGFAGRPTTVQMLEITGANPVPEAGIPD